jgi:FdrA protein
MSVVLTEVRPGAYYDSIVLMQLQRALSALPGVEDAGVVMGTAANQDLLSEAGLASSQSVQARPEDLVLVVKAASEELAAQALGEIDTLLQQRSKTTSPEYRPRSLEVALRDFPDAGWVLISVPGRYAAEVARRSVAHGRNVFLYSDNVPLEEEVALKRQASERGLLVMGPDCGTAWINGVGLGFANRVRKGVVGLVGASGTGLQAIMAGLHRLGAGVSQAIGTGGRDLHAEVGGITALQALDLLARDDETQVIVLVSKPPQAEVAARLLAFASGLEKPVVVDFLGYPPPHGRSESDSTHLQGRSGLYYAASLSEAAGLAARLSHAGSPRGSAARPAPTRGAIPGFVRGLFSGGTLAHQALLSLQPYLSPLHSNISQAGVHRLENPNRSQGHTLLDLGADEFTVGRLHPMIDNELRLRRMRQEWADQQVGMILLDVVLGEGSHPDPAGELAPVIAELGEQRPLPLVIMLIGTEDDPQGLDAQKRALEDCGARVFLDPDQALEHVSTAFRKAPAGPDKPISLETLRKPLSAINVGLELFHDSLMEQGAESVQVDWRPPAQGDPRMMEILRKMRD